MGHSGYTSPFLLLAMVAGLASISSAEATDSASTGKTIEEKNRLLGRDLAVKNRYDTTASERGVETTTDVKFLGKNRTLLESNVEYIPGETTNDPGSAESDLYVGGMRVWTGKGRFEKGSFIYEGGIAPSQMAWPIVTYPLGPVLLQIDAGISYEVGVEARVTPFLSYPIEFSSIGASVKANASASGYVEGYANFLVVRGGVGGELTVLDGYGKVAADIYFNQKPVLNYAGKLTLLQGRIYGFVDTFNVFGWKWKRWWNPTLFSWDGKCWAFGGESCVAF